MHANDLDNEHPAPAYVIACMHHSGRMDWRIEQEGMYVARGFAPNSAAGYAELCRYVMQYASEGPMKVEARFDGGRWQILDVAA